MKIPAIIALACLAAGACTDGGKTDTAPVPKPYAYPRFVPYPDSAARVAIGGLSFLVNASATATAKDDSWLDIAYPRYRSTVLLSVTRSKNDRHLADAIANRRERISLNLGGHTARTDRFSNKAGYECEIVVSAETPSTPVQFIAVGPDRTMVSGAVTMAESHGTDSVAPVVKALEGDIFTLLKSIEP